MPEETYPITLQVNGIPYDLTVPARRLLSDCLRHDLGLTGTHVGCEHGVCGACTVLVDGHVDPEGDIHATADYRRQLARVLTGRALEQAVVGARNGGRRR